MKGNRYTIALLSVIIVCLMAMPAMAGNLDELETRCWGGNCLDGTITDGTVIVLCNMTGLPTIGNWTFTLPEGEVVAAYMHWHRWGACHGTDTTAEFWNSDGAYESIGFAYPDEDPVLYEDHGVWFTPYSPRNGNHHYYWKVNASAGANTFKATGCYPTSGEHCDGRWFVAVINNTDEGNRTHDGHWWHNTGYEKTSSSVEQETRYYNASGNPINIAANYTLWTAQSHYGSSTPSIEFNGESVGNVGSGCDGHGDGSCADYSLCEFNVPIERIEADGNQMAEWKYAGDSYYVNFGTLAEVLEEEGGESTCLGDCYEGTVCEGTLIAENMNCAECLAEAGRSWENYEFESPCNPGYMVPRLCYDYCPECCDGINNNDGDAYIDWPNDPECACCLDETEATDEGCPVPCVPELATFTLVGIGLMMFAGVVYRRKE